MSYRPQIPDTGFVTPHWVKRHYSISNSTLYSWLKNLEGFPQPYRVGHRAMRFRVEDLRDFEAKLLAKGKEV